MEPYSPCLVTTPVLDTPSEVWLGKARCEAKEMSSDVRSPRNTSMRNWVELGGLVVLLTLACCVASCLATRLNAASTRAAPFVSADCQQAELSVPLQHLHLGAQVHFRLRNLHCQQEQEVEPQHLETTNVPYADCRADPAGLLQRFHLGAQVPYPPRTPGFCLSDPSVRVTATIPRPFAPPNLFSDHTSQVSRVLRERDCLAAWSRDL